MAWVVDTCLVIDVLDDDPEFGLASAKLLDARLSEGLVLCPVSYVELAPAFLGDDSRQREFLEQVGLDVSAGWEWADTQAAHRAWNRYIELRCARKAARRSFGKLRTAPSELEGRPVADVLIGAFAANRSGLLTRNPSDFSAVYPSLRILTPAG